jgi:hypothetical protein
MEDGFATPSRQCAAVNTIRGAITEPVQYWLNVSIAATPGTDPTAPPAMSSRRLVVAGRFVDLDGETHAA